MSTEDQAQSIAERDSVDVFVETESVSETESVWDEAERNFWNECQEKEELERAELQAAHQPALEEVKIKAKALEAQRIEAVRARDRLRQQLEAAEEELADIATRCEKNKEQNANIKKDLEEDLKGNEEYWEGVKRQMTRWLLRRRGHQVPSDTEDDVDQPETQTKSVENAAAKCSLRLSPQLSPERPVKRSRGSNTRGGLYHDNGNEADENHERGPFAHAEVQHQEPVEKVSGLKPETTWALSSGEALTVIKDADGKFIGPVKRLKTRNQWQDALLQLPIKRDIRVRRGRHFGQADLESIYKRMERRGLKWLACMIQATGEIREKPCEGCRMGLGPFSDCISVEDGIFPRCGNCQWSRRGCCDAAHWDDDDVEDESQEKGVRSAEEQAQLAGAADLKTISPLGMQHEMGQEHDQESDQRSERERDTNGQPKWQRPLDQSLERARELGPEREPEQEQEQTMSTALPARAKVSESDVDIDMADHDSMSSPLTSLAADVPSPQWPLFEGPADGSDMPITRENLVLKHNGTIYTFPEIFDGVPVEKVDENHPYWDPSWHDVKSSTKQALDRWLKRLEEWKQLKARGAKTIESHRFSIGRQINRGLRILDFLERGEISPYQLLGKRFTVAGKGGITTYDTLFRLCETLAELEKFRLDVRPLEWVRHRIYEIWLEQGKSMSVRKVIGSLYNDPKLVALRTEAGFKSVGRPAGAGNADRPGGAAVPLSTDTPCRQADKRKSFDGSLVPSPAKRPRLSLKEPSPRKTSTLVEVNVEKDAQDYIKPLGDDEPNDADDDDDDDDVPPSDTDTYSGGALSKDDFRVYQVKSRLYTSCASVTQYLHWIRGKHKFQHQVLKDVNPVHWGFLKQPIDFDVLIKDIAGALFNADALLLELVLNKEGQRLFKKDGLPQGNVMIAFKRSSTLKRFIKCLRDLGVPATNLPIQVMKAKWAGMKSEQLPDSDADASEEFLN